jgi:hypothetical protein
MLPIASLMGQRNPSAGGGGPPLIDFAEIPADDNCERQVRSKSVKFPTFAHVLDRGREQQGSRPEVRVYAVV